MSAPRSAAVLIAAAALAVSPAGAAILLSDDFESYTTTAALNAVWAVGGGSDSTTFLDFGPSGSSNVSQTVHSTNRDSWRTRNFTGQAPTVAEPIRVSVDMYYDGDAGSSEYVQLLSNSSGGSLSQLMAMGFTTLATTNGANDPTKFQARLAFGSSNWINLNTPRTEGWHNFTAIVHPDTVDFYVDGALDTAGVTYTGGVGDAFSTFRLGSSGLTARAEQGFYDNAVVEAIPEPATAGLLVLGLAALTARRRKN